MVSSDNDIFILQIITSVDASRLKLTKLDDKIYETFRKSFPDLSIAKITDDDIKTPAEKEVSKT